MSAGRAIAAAGFVILVVSGWIGWVEAQPYLNRGRDAEDTMGRILRTEMVPGISEQSVQQFAADCLEVFGSLYYRTRTKVDRDAFATACRSELEPRTLAAPAFSFGWYALATADSVLNDVEALNRDLIRSQNTGANEQWIAEQRVQLAENRLADLNADALAGESRDLTVLAASHRGVQTIAERYVADPDFRERITAIVEKLPADAQARFLGYVREAASSP